MCKVEWITSVLSSPKVIIFYDPLLFPFLFLWAVAEKITLIAQLTSSSTQAYLSKNIGSIIFLRFDVP